MHFKTGNAGRDMLHPMGTAAIWGGFAKDDSYN